MMKFKFTSYVLSLCIIFGGIGIPNVFAEEDGKSEILIEAENFESGTNIFDIARSDEYSGGKMLVSRAYPNDEADYLYSYTFNAKESGYYKFSGIFNKQHWTPGTDMEFYVNDSDNKVESLTDGSNRYLEAYDYTGGFVYLNQGKNTLYVKVDKTDSDPDLRFTLYLDCFKFTKASQDEFKLEKIRFEDTSAGAFEENKNVRVLFEYNTKTPAMQNYNLQIQDMWEREVSNQTVTIPKGIERFTLDLGSFPIGWYRVFIKDFESNVDLIDYMAFSVTVSHSKRLKVEDSTIATDANFYGNHTVRNVLPKGIDSYIEALKLSGVTWIREHTLGKASINDQYYKIAQKVKKLGIKQLDLTTSDTVVRNDNVADRTLLVDLHEAYLQWKEFADLLGDNCDVLENVNEADITTGVPADRYSSYYKAAAIGISDSEANTYQTMSPPASSAGLWVDTYFQNDILDYTDIQNAHAHNDVKVRTEAVKKYALAYADEPLALWHSEAGIQQFAPDGVTLTNEQMRAAVSQQYMRFLTMISSGCTKWFWFLFTPYTENGGNYSSMHPSGMPYPMYSALANMTYQFGAAKYIGKPDLPSNVSGYMLDDGNGNDVLACYSDQQCYITIKADKVKYSDVLGHEEIKTADSNGEIRLFLGENDPIIVKYFGRAPKDSYYPKSYSGAYSKKTFTPAQRLVIQQDWRNITDDKTAGNQGYQLEPGKEYEFTAKIFNLNDKKMTGKLKKSADSCIQWETDDEPAFEIEPWQSQEYKLKFTVDASIEYPVTGSVRLWGETSEGDELSSSVAAFKVVMTRRQINDEDRVDFENYWTADRWDVGNIAPGGKAVRTDDGKSTVSFNVTFTGPRWFFPYFKLTESEIEKIKDSQGFVANVKTRKSSERTEIQMFIYMKDGRMYYCGTLGYYFNDMTDDYTCCVFPFTSFELYSSPMGNFEMRTFNPADIEQISIGAYVTPEIVPQYDIQKFGYFYSTVPSDQLNKDGDISLDIEDKVYSPSELGTYEAKYNMNDEISEVKVVLNEDKYDKVKINKDGVSIDLSGLERGRYTIYVFALNNQKKMYQTSKTFTVK